MFTGIIEEVGKVARITPGQGGGRIVVIESRFDPATIAIGDSIATSGVCLTVTHKEGSRFSIDAGPETLARTTIGELRSGSRVNLERSMALGAKIGGHLVQGHVDGLGTVLSISARENAYDLVIDAPAEIAPLIAPRGSIAVDGISLTVTSVQGTKFGISIIPHTWRVTTISDCHPGSKVNLEADMIARYVARLLEAQKPASGGITEEFLKKHGF